MAAHVVAIAIAPLTRLSNTRKADINIILVPFSEPLHIRAASLLSCADLRTYPMLVYWICHHECS